MPSAGAGPPSFDFHSSFFGLPPPLPLLAEREDLVVFPWTWEPSDQTPVKTVPSLYCSDDLRVERVWFC